MKYKLRDISIGSKGVYGLAASSSKFVDGYPEYLRITDISDDSTIPTKLETCVDINKYPRYKNFLLQPYDLVIARTGNSTGRNYMLTDSKREIVFAGFLVRFSINKQLINPIFVKYYFQSEDCKSQILSLCTGSTRKNVNAKLFEKIEIPVPSSSLQQHIVDTIGSVDDLIEKYEAINTKIYDMCDLILKAKVKNIALTEIGNLNYIKIIQSKIDKFEGNKIYLDTSSVQGDQIVDDSYIISYKKRPSRANMQPQANSVWFAKMKNSPKFIIVKKQSKDLLNKFIFSTGYLGLATNEKTVNYLYVLIKSENFQTQKDMNTNGSTMQAINNESFAKIMVPKIDLEESVALGSLFEPFVNTIIKNQQAIYRLKQIKSALLQKYFG